MTCDKPSTVLLLEVYGTTVLPFGAFCSDHWGIEKERMNDHGQRMGMQVIRPEDGTPPPCSHELPSTPKPGR